jgi:hypothetical protein
MPGFYLMPNGKVAAVALDGGRKSLVSRAKFEECCCPPLCQWMSVFEWSCLETGWRRTADLWVPMAEINGTVVEVGECLRRVYGLAGFCSAEDEQRPAMPPDFEGDAPDDPSECHVPCACPEGLLDAYSMVYNLSRTTFPDGVIVEFRRMDMPRTLERTTGCNWADEELSPLERRVFHPDTGWGDWEEPFNFNTAGLSLLTPFGSCCYWAAGVTGSATGRGFKETGDPIGYYYRKFTDFGNIREEIAVIE